MEKGDSGMKIQKRSISESVDKHKSGKFGYFGINPFFLQWMNSPWVFLVLIMLAMIGNTCAVVGVLSTVLPQIEKRFGLSSFDSGMVAAANDVAAVLFGIFVAHWGNYGNKVRWIGVGGIITGIGLLINALPHFIIDKYKPPLPANILCGLPPGLLPPMNITTAGNNTGGGMLPPTPCDAQGEIAERYHLALILIGQFIAGVGTIPLFTLPPAIFRETVKERYIPTCFALWQASVVVGPMIAFAFTDPMLETWVDITKPSDDPTLTPQDPRWIGAWWIGFLGPAGFCFLVGLITLGLPEHIKSQLNDSELDKIKQIHEVDRGMTLKEQMREIPRILKALFTNWAFIFNSLAYNVTLLFLEGLTPFIPKILILRFGVEIDDLGKTLNLALVPAVVLGVLLSIFLLRIVKIENSGKKAALICFVLHFGSILAPLACLLDGCDNVNLAGHNVPYGVRVPSSSGGINITTTFPSIPGYPLGSTCNGNCSCGLGSPVPICGTDGISYLTPCFAGCKIPVLTENPTFHNCSCIPSADGYGGFGKIGFCDGNCKNWLEFLAMISVFSLIVFAELSPSKVVIMRTVKPEHLSFAFGLYYFSNKLIAQIPGPILFGHVVDLSCEIWQKVCDKTGFCMLYDVDYMMLQLAIITGTLGGLGILFYGLSWFMYKDAVKDMDTNKKQLEINNQGYMNDDDKNGLDTKI